MLLKFDTVFVHSVYILYIGYWMWLLWRNSQDDELILKQDLTIP